VTVFLILGLPGSSYETDSRSISWAQENGLDIHLSFYLSFDEISSNSALFDNPKGRNLPDSYNSALQLKLYQSLYKRLG
jgi:hypothetical protein